MDILTGKTASEYKGVIQIEKIHNAKGMTRAAALDALDTRMATVADQHDLPFAHIPHTDFNAMGNMAHHASVVTYKDCHLLAYLTLRAVASFPLTIIEA